MPAFVFSIGLVQRQGRVMMRTRIAAVVFVLLGTTLMGMPIAAAAPPSNDDIANATTVTEPLPFTDSVDTTEATELDESDPSCSFSEDYFVPWRTVWYVYTPTTSGTIDANTFGSDFDTTLLVAVGSPGNLTPIACNDDSDFSLQSLVTWDATAGTTYYIMAGGFAGDAGNLQFTVEVSLGPFTLVNVTINRTGLVDPPTGRVVILGTVTCEGRPEGVFIDVLVKQRIGRLRVEGGGGGSVEACAGTQSWRAEVDSCCALFVAGKVLVDVLATDFNNTQSQLAEATVTLRGH